jgi:hypothetical protein
MHQKHPYLKPSPTRHKEGFVGAASSFAMNHQTTPAKRGNVVDVVVPEGDGTCTSTDTAAMVEMQIDTSTAPPRLGQVVAARREGGNQYYRGKIAAVRKHVSFDIKYDDGIREERVPPEFIEKLVMAKRQVPFSAREEGELPESAQNQVSVNSLPPKRKTLRMDGHALKSTEAPVIFEITVTIRSGRKLVAKDNFLGNRTKSDPYVEIFCGKSKMGKTSIVKKSLNPKWGKEDYGETFRLAVGSLRLESSKTIECLVFDHHTISSDDPMGAVSIPMPALNALVADWYQVKKGEGKNFCHNAGGELHVEVSLQGMIFR